jgi:hypothetical protein
MKRRSQIALSPIRYRTDLISPDAPTILLGVLVELQAPTANVVALYARKSLTSREAAKLDGIARIQLKDPFKYLESQCGQALAFSDGNILSHLATQHGWALNIEQPVVQQLSQTLRKAKRPETIVARLAEDWLVREAKKGETSQPAKTKIKRKTPGRRAFESVRSPAPRRRNFEYTLRVHGAAMHV